MRSEKFTFNWDCVTEDGDVTTTKKVVDVSNLELVSRFGHIINSFVFFLQMAGIQSEDLIRLNTLLHINDQAKEEDEDTSTDASPAGSIEDTVNNPTNLKAFIDSIAKGSPEYQKTIFRAYLEYMGDDED